MVVLEDLGASIFIIEPVIVPLWISIVEIFTLLIAVKTFELGDAPVADRKNLSRLDLQKNRTAAFLHSCMVREFSLELFNTLFGVLHNSRQILTAVPLEAKYLAT